MLPLATNNKILAVIDKTAVAKIFKTRAPRSGSVRENTQDKWDYQ
jgi:hypothetical protein